MFCREICYETLELVNDSLGGVGTVVEVDEAKFGKRKFNRGRRVDGIWVFGAIERGSLPAKCVLIPVQDRTEESLLSEIRKFILPGTTIISDCWASYQNLSSHGYFHLTVNHSACFKDPITGAHTNSVEGMWNLARRSLPKFGTTKTMYSSYFCEFMYRRKYFSQEHRKYWFSIFLSHIASLY